jgi:hypothetical protein
MSTDVPPVHSGRPDVLRRIRHRARCRLGTHPFLYLPLARRRYPGPSPQVIGPETELVIDGYTRCASTFAVYALQLAQDRPVRLAHHLHAPAQIIAAARTGVPTLVLIREPRGAVMSEVVREPGVTLSDALTAYARFYSCLLPYRDRVVVGEFQEVIRDFGAVVRQLNARFGTSFREFVPTDVAVRECQEIIRRRGASSPIQLAFESGLVGLDDLRRDLQDASRTGVVEDAAELWVPSPARGRAIERLADLWDRPNLARSRHRAEQAYEVFLGRGGARA